MESISSQAHPAMTELLEQEQLLLIVDGERRMRSSLRRLLAKDGLKIIDCSTGVEAVSILKDNDITLIVLDINLQDITGLEILEWIKQNNMRTKAIIVSTDDNSEIVLKFLRFGALEFVRKPQDMDLLCQKVNDILYKHHLEQKSATLAELIKHSEQLYRFLVENCPDIIYTLDQSGCFTYVSGKINILLGYDREELIGSHYSSIVHKDDQAMAMYAFVERRCDNRATSNMEVRLKCKSADFENRYIVAMLNAIGIYHRTKDSSYSFAGTYGVARDITEQKLSDDSIKFQAMHDQLTMLPNRRLFIDRLEHAIAQSKRSGRPLAVMFIDLDSFKIVNDRFGHAEGDELLRNVAKRFSGCVRTVDTLARLGGDEFTVLLPDLTNTDDVNIVATKIVNELNKPFIISNCELVITASIGISIHPNDGDTIDVLMKNADIAMYKVKESSKNGYMSFSSKMNTTPLDHIVLGNELNSAIRNAELELYFQPQIDVIQNTIIGMEALLRWKHPYHGLLSPEQFINIAEESGLISSISDWVLDESCKQLMKWRSMWVGNLKVSVNLSPKDFEFGAILYRVLSKLSKYNLPASSLEIKITEDLLLPEVKGVIEVLRLLLNAGVLISFGTKYASLNNLRQFPVSSIKIDKSFVHDIKESNNSSEIVSSIINIAKEFELKLIATGVETVFQKTVLSNLGCEIMQGYLFSRPLPVTEATQLLYQINNNHPCEANFDFDRCRHQN